MLRVVSPNTVTLFRLVEFQPDWPRLGRRIGRNRKSALLRKLKLGNPNYATHSVYEYETVVSRMLAKERPSYIRFPCVTPMWDNTARRRHGAAILKDSSPRLYQTWLAGAIEKFLPQEAGYELVFLNAWNEWAEGNHLEPCQRWGHAYLEATKAVLFNGLHRLSKR
jgi:hypothetical protein